jgi:hypothetical protein
LSFFSVKVKPRGVSKQEAFSNFVEYLQSQSNSQFGENWHKIFNDKRESKCNHSQPWFFILRKFEWWAVLFTYYCFLPCCPPREIFEFLKMYSALPSSPLTLNYTYIKSRLRTVIYTGEYPFFVVNFMARLCAIYKKVNFS